MSTAAITSRLEPAQQTAAKVAGFAYLFTFASVVFARFRIHDRLIIEGNAAETARNILARERLFRIGIACDLIYCVGVVVLLAGLYWILEPVNHGLALLSALWRFVYALMWVLMTLSLFDALRLVRGADYLQGIRGRAGASIGESVSRRTLRSVLRWFAVLRIGIDSLQLLVVSVWVHS
jgi:Domain of unknown function (DUF4386)